MILISCGCKNKTRYQVKVAGKIVFVTGNLATANSVATRYPGGVVVTVEP